MSDTFPEIDLEAVEAQRIANVQKTDDIENRFGYHPPKNAEAVAKHELVRAQAKSLAHYAAGNLPDGREKAMALTKLEEYMFWANAAIARERELENAS